MMIMMIMMIISSSIIFVREWHEVISNLTALPEENSFFLAETTLTCIKLSHTT